MNDFTPAPKRLFLVHDGRIIPPEDNLFFWMGSEGECCSPEYEMMKDHEGEWLYSTGLHDADGVEIIEGHVLRLLTRMLGKTLVTVQYKHGQFYPFGEAPASSASYALSPSMTRVIGHALLPEK